MNSINKKITYRISCLLIFCILLFVVIVFKDFDVDKNKFEKIDYKKILNLYVLNDGTLRVEENIELDKNNYSTYFLINNKYDEVKYSKNIENLKVYYNNVELDTNKENINGYYIYKYDNKILDSKQVDLKFSEYNNIDIFLPNHQSNLKIVYDIRDYIVNYNDISYFQYNLNYNYNIFNDEVKINVIMPESPKAFDIYTNIELKNNNRIKDIDSYKKELSIYGLEKENLHLEFVFDKNIVNSKIKINEDKNLSIKEKYNELEKENLKLHIVFLVSLIVMAIGIGIGSTIKIWNRENRGKLPLLERNNVKFHYFKVLFIIMLLTLLFYIITKII